MFVCRKFDEAPVDGHLSHGIEEGGRCGSSFDEFKEILVLRDVDVVEVFFGAGHDDDVAQKRNGSTR